MSFPNFITTLHNFITIARKIFLPLLQHMKKILAILFSIFYFGFSSGAVFSVHYCMQEMVSVSQKTNDICAKCCVKTKKDCCKTEIKVVKVDDSQKSDFLKIDFLKQIATFQKQEFFFIDQSFSATKFTQIQINAPPESRSIPIFITHCNFRI
jgi:hypothetical protein